MHFKTYGDKELEDFDKYGVIGKGCKWASLSKIVRRKLDIMHSAHSILDLRVPPNNHFKWLRGDLAGFASIRINNQWRIIFMINSKNAFEKVVIIDYH